MVAKTESQEVKAKLEADQLPPVPNLTISGDIEGKDEIAKMLGASVDWSDSAVGLSAVDSPMGSSSDFMGESPATTLLAAPVAAQVASIRNSINPGKDIKEHYVDVQADMSVTGDLNIIAEQAISQYQQYYNSILQDMVSEELDSQGTDPAQLGQDVREIMDSTLEAFTGPDRLEVAQILATTGTIDKQLAERQFYGRKIVELVENTGTFENIFNYAGLMLLDWRFDSARITGGSFFDVKEDLKNIMRNFQSLPVEERLLLFPHLVKNYMDAADDNEIKAAGRLIQTIDPRASREVEFENIADIVEWAAIAAPLVTSLARSTKHVNTINTVANTGGKDIAGNMNGANLADASETVSEALEVSREVSAANTSPFEFQQFIPEANDTIAASTAESFDKVNKVRSEVQAILADVASEKHMLREGILTPDERVLADKKALKTFEDLQQEYYTSYGWYSDQARIVNRTPDGITVETTLNGTNPLTKTFTYKINDVGTFDVVEAGQIETKLASPSVWMDKIERNAVETATLLGFQSARLMGDIQAATRRATKDIQSLVPLARRKSLRKIDDVLLKMDDADGGKGRVFSFNELKYIYNLSDKEVASVYAIRDVFDTLHYMKNTQVYRALDAEGFKEVAIKGVDSDKDIATSIARPYEQVNHIPTDIVRDPEFKIWNSSARKGKGAVTKLSRLNLNKLYGEGYKVVKFKDRAQVGDELVEYGLVKQDHVRDLPAQVINKKAAYVPKSYKDGYYFVKQATGAVVNGKKVRAGDSGAVVKTVRVFGSKLEAEQFANTLRASVIDPITGKTFKDGHFKYEVKHDRELTPSQLEAEVVDMHGGLYTSSRASHEIKYGLGVGSTPRRVSAFEALQRNYQHIANNYPMNEFRMGMQQRWLNSANMGGRTALKDPTDFNSDIILEKGSKAEVALRESREWIRDQMHIPTNHEQRWDAMMRHLAEWMEEGVVLDKIPGKEKVRRGVQLLGSKDPFAAIRAAAFHALLGWGNPAQLWVQAQGWNIAFALNPIAAPARVRQYMALRAAMFLGNKAAIRKTAKAAGVDEDEFLEIVTQFNKSGLMQSVKSTADHAAGSQSYNIGADALRKWADRGLFFFREGETFTRGYAFLTARSMWKKKNPNKKIDDDALKDIVKMTTTKMLNLNRANRAHWQKGVWSIPTQFQQITAKFIENMLPNIFPGASKKFTFEQKVRIMTGQFFLYGAAGVPLGKWAADNILHMGGDEPGSMSKEAAARWTDGFWGWVSAETVGSAPAVGERGAFASGIDNLLRRFVLNDPSVPDVALGAFGTIPERGMRAIETLRPMLLRPHEFKWSKDEVIKGLTAALTPISTFNNLHQAHLWYSMGHVTDSKGVPLYRLDKSRDMETIFFKATGFTPKRLSDHYASKGWNMRYDKMMREKAQALRRQLIQYYGNPELTEDMKTNNRIYQSVILAGMTEMQVMKIQKMVIEPLAADELPEVEQLKKMLERHIESGDTTSGLEGMMFNEQLSR